MKSSRIQGFGPLVWGLVCLGCISGATVAQAQERKAEPANQELPKVIYIVPWKKAVQGEVSTGRPLVSVLNDEPAPLARDVLRRQIQYSSSQATIRTVAPAEPTTR